MVTEAAVRELWARRDGPARGLADAAPTIAAACQAMATRFADGGKLLAFGSGGPTTDAQHVSVEFVHPVLVGKRALPALSLVADTATTMGIARRHGPGEVFAHQIGVLGHADDIAVGISSDGDDIDVLRGLETAHRDGLLTIALLGGDGGAIAASGFVDHVVVVASADAHVVKEVHVTAYHVLWELTHVFYDHAQRTASAPAAATSSLYPFLHVATGDEDGAATFADAVASTGEKATQIADLRVDVGDAMASSMAMCADALVAAFSAGGKLLACGNGGSSSDAQEVAQSFLDPPTAWQALPALCLTNDVAVLTALSNDVNFDVVFARQVHAFGRAGDIFLGLSTSGNSDNLIAAFEAAKGLGMITVGLAGSGGGRMATSNDVDHLFVVPSDSVHRIQETQTTIYHVLRELVAQGLPA